MTRVWAQLEPGSPWRGWLVAGLLMACSLTACGGKKEEEAPPVTDGAGSAEVSDGASSAAPPGVSDGASSTGEPVYGEESPGGGEYAEAGPGEGLPGETPAAAPATVKPLFASNANPFAPLDPPTQLPPPMPPPPASQRIQTIRADLNMPPARDEAETPEAPSLPGLKTSGLLWGATIKAIVQFNDESKIVRPGEVFVFGQAAPGREFQVVAIGTDGVRLREVRTGRVYWAEYRRR